MSLCQRRGAASERSAGHGLGRQRHFEANWTEKPPWGVRPGVLHDGVDADAAKPLSRKHRCRRIDDPPRDFQCLLTADSHETSWHPEKMIMTIDIKKIN